MSNTETRPRFFIENEVLDEVYAVREAIAASFDYDIHKYCEYLRSLRTEIEEQGFKFADMEDLKKRQEQQSTETREE